MSESQNAKKPCESRVCPSQFEEASIASFNLLTSNLQEVYNKAHAEKEAAKEYMNEYQVMLIDFMHSLPLADNLKDELHKVVLAIQVQSHLTLLELRMYYLKLLWILKKVY